MKHEEKDRFDEDEIKDVMDFLEMELTLEDVKALFITLIEKIFDGNRESAIKFLRKYLQNKANNSELTTQVKPMKRWK